MAIPAMRHPRETPPETRVDLATPATDQPMDLALSPDGRQIASVAAGDAVPRLWLRSLATTTAQPLAGAEGATYPSSSPDSRSLGFFAGGNTQRQLTRVDRSGVAHGAVGDPDATFGLPRVSPDGRRMTVSRTVQGNMDVWLLDGTRASWSAFTCPRRRASERTPIVGAWGAPRVFSSDCWK
jgi:Tol biopolymer transport system component